MIIPLRTITFFLDELLKTQEISDYKNALNGLQVENKGEIRKIAVAVDASEKAIKQAIELHADLLIVHHGLFWSGLSPITGAWFRKLSLCIENNLAVYSSHLPLDIHPSYGNNVVMAEASGLEIIEKKGICFEGNSVGVLCQFDGTLEELTERIHLATEMEVRAYPAQGKSNKPGKILLCSGGAGDELHEAIKMGINTFVTGEGSHWTLPLAQEEGIHLIYAGHYATETFGVKSLASQLSKKFGIPTEFIDDEPTPFICS